MASNVDQILAKYSQRSPQASGAAPTPSPGPIPSPTGDKIDAILSKYQADSGNSLSDTIETAARSTAEGGTLGLSEPVFSGANAVIGNLVDAGFDHSDIKDFLSKAVDTQRLKKAYQDDVDRRRQMKADHPYADLGGELAGAVAPLVVSGGTALAAKAGLTTAEEAAAAAKLAKNTNLSGKMIDLAGATVDKTAQALGAGKLADIPLLGRAARIGIGAVKGAASTLATEVPKRAIESATGFIQDQDQAPGLVDMAQNGAILGGKLSAIPEAVGLAQSAGKGVLSALGGVKPKVITDYLNSPEAVKAAPSVPDLKSMVDDASSKIQETLKGKKGDFVDNVLGAVDALKQKVIQGSQAAYDILGQSEEEVNTASVKRAITAAKKDLLVAGKVPVGQSAQNAVARLDSYRDTFDQLPQKISLPDAKQILQQMDDDIDYAQKAGEFGSRAGNAVKAVRYSLDQMVKTRSPDYSKAMEQVASDAKTLSEMSDRFGTQDSVFNKINKFGTPNGDMEMQALKRLQQSSGVKLMPQLGEIQGMAPAAAINEGNSQSVIQSVMRGNSIENQKKLQMLSQLSDQDFVAMAKNAGTRQAFDQEFRAGSQHVNLWGVIGMAGIGGITGDHIGGGIGAMGGVVLGALTTKYGPAATRSILDGVSKIQGMPTVQKIDRFIQNVPPQAKEELKQDLVRMMAIHQDGSPSTSISISDDQLKQTRKDIQTSPGLSNSEKAKALDSLNRTGMVNEVVMRRVATGGQAQHPAADMKAPAPRAQPSAIPIDQVLNNLRKKKPGGS